MGLAEKAALLEADAFRFALERGVQNLDPLLGHLEVAEIAPTAGLIWARGPPPIAVGRSLSGAAFGRGVTVVIVAYLLGEFIEFGLGLRELDLPRVDALGFGQEDAPTQQLELPLELLVRVPKLVTLRGDRRERGARLR